VVEHNGRGEQQILLEWVDVRLDIFIPGTDPYYAVPREADELIGAGPIEPMRFLSKLIQRDQTQLAGWSGAMMGKIPYWWHKDPTS
jgi:hypothetical protein